MEDTKVASSIIQMIRRYPNLETLRVAKPPGKLAIFMVEREPSVVVVDTEVAPALVVKAKSRLPNLNVIVVAHRDEVLSQPVNTSLSTRIIASDCNQKEFHALLDTLLDDARQATPASPVADMIALFSVGDHYGSLEIRNTESGEQGSINFSSGALASAETAELDGFNAINLMKTWRACSFKWTHLIEGLDDDILELEDVSSPVGNVSDFLHYEPGLVEATDTSMFPMSFAPDESDSMASAASDSFIPSGLADHTPSSEPTSPTKASATKAKPTLRKERRVAQPTSKLAPVAAEPAAPTKPAQKPESAAPTKKVPKNLDSSTETFISKQPESSSQTDQVQKSFSSRDELHVVSSLNASATPQGSEQPNNPTIGAQMASNATEILQELTGIAGFIAGAVVDSDSGMTLAKVTNSMSFDIDVAAATNTEVIKAKLRAAKALKLEDGIEDILITLTHQYHLLRPLEEYPSIFFYVALDREQANLAMARIKLKTVGSKIKL